MEKEVAGIWRPLAVSGGAQHSCEVALQRDLQVVAIGLEHDRLDERSNGVRRARAAVLAFQRQTEATDLLAIHVRHTRVQQLRNLRCVESRLELRPPGFELHQLVLDGQRGHAVLDGLNQLPDLALHRRDLVSTVRQAGAVLHAQAIQLAHVLSAEVLEEVPAHQLVAKCDEDSFFNLLAADGQAISAHATRPGAEARQAIAPIHHVTAAALGTFRQTGEEILRAACPVELFGIAVRRNTAHLDLPRLHLAPELVVDDSQLGNGGRHPLGWRVWSRDTLPGVWILDVAKSIPHKPADIQLVVQNSGAPGRIAVNCAGIPRSAAGPRTALRVESSRDGLRGQTCCVVAEYPADHFRFGRNDLAVACRRRTIVSRARHLVAVAETAPGLPELDSAAKSSARLIGEIFQEEGVHRALQPNVQVRDVALSERDDAHASERQTLEQSGSVLLVPAESVERFGQDNVELPVQRVAHQRLETGAKQCGAGDRVIGEFVNNRPTLAPRVLAAHPQLVRNRSVALIVRRVPGVDGDLQCSVTSGCVARSAATSRSNRSRAASRARARTSARNRSSP